MTIEIGEEGLTEHEQIIMQVIEAWEALPGGYHSPKEVERWMHNYMKPAIDAARKAMGQPIPKDQE